MEKCPVCGRPNCVMTHDGDNANFECVRCGRYGLTGSALVVLEKSLQEAPLSRAIMSHALRRMQRPGLAPKSISSYELPSYWAAGRLPTPQEQADLLVLWIGDHLATPDAVVRVPHEELAATVGTSVSTGNPGMVWLFDELAPRKLLHHRSEPNAVYVLSLTIDGWARYEELHKVRSESRTAFMAMKFGDDVLDRVVLECFKPAVARAGFELRKLTDEQPAGLIDNQIRSAILSGRFVVADLSHGSHGAYWEAGFAEGLGLPVLHLRRECVEGTQDALRYQPHAHNCMERFPTY